MYYFQNFCLILLASNPVPDYRMCRIANKIARQVVKYFSLKINAIYVYFYACASVEIVRR